MPVHVTNSTRIRLQRESWARRYQEEHEIRMSERMNTYIKREVPKGSVKPYGLAAGLLGVALNMELTRWASESKTEVIPGSVPAFGGPR